MSILVPNTHFLRRTIRLVEKDEQTDFLIGRLQDGHAFGVRRLIRLRRRQFL